MDGLVFSGDGVWVRRPAGGHPEPAAPPLDLLQAPGAIIERLPMAEGHPVLVLDATGSPLPDGVEAMGLRQLHDAAPAAYRLAQQAFQLLHWRRTHRFCGTCGRPLTRHTAERAMQCSGCGTLFFPRLNPVAITRITRDGEILLARRATGYTAFYSVIAGFVEAGETLEQTVEREVAEEVGIRVRNIRYFASQPWPFPNNLMIAFTAEYASGDIRPDGVEIAEAAWFPPDSLPPIPHPISISRRLIDDFTRTQAAGTPA